MRLRSVVRGLLIGTALVGAPLLGASCYRAEVDLTPLLDDEQPSGGGVLTTPMAGAAGEPGGVEPAAGGAGSMPECGTPSDDPVQNECRLRQPSSLQCDEQDSRGWPACYAGGCSICAEVLRDYPSYLFRHPCCVPNGTCGVHAPVKCSPLCPPPEHLDKLEPCPEVAR